MPSPSRLFAACLVLFGVWASLASELTADEPAKIHADLVYGHKDGMALTIDIIQPAQPNGAAVLWIQSGGWYSSWTEPQLFLVAG